MTKIILIMLFFLQFSSSTTLNEITYVGDEINVFKEVAIEKVIPVLQTYNGPITGYGPDCYGCSGITASGYNVSKTIYYHDKEYGKVRILAADKTLPFGTIIRIKDLNIFDEPVLAIVLDRGSAIGFNKKSYFDLLYKSEKDTNFFGKRYATFEVLRRGY